MSDEKASQSVSPAPSIRDEKAGSDSASEYIHANLKDLDVGLKFAAGHAEDFELTPAESTRLRRKLDWRLLPLLCLIYTVQFIDKGTLASASILGIIQDNKLTTNDFNNLSSAFYIGYLIFEYPQNFALQYFPVGKWITFNIFLWALFLGLQAACTNYGGLFALRLLLGAAEGCMSTGLMIIIGMFYTRREIGERIGWVFQCNGLATIIIGFIAFGVAHVGSESKVAPWQWLIIVNTLLTLGSFLLFVFFFPDNPTTARFLTEEEKVRCVKRVQENRNGIETKSWKKSQMLEALKDPKTYLFAFAGGFISLQGGIGVQYSIIIKSYGFTTLQTTLLNIPSGFAQIIGISSAGYALRWFPNSRFIIGIIWFIPCYLACLLQLLVPFSNRAAHLVGIYLIYFGGSPAFIMLMSVVSSNISGHTKKVTTNAIFLIGYALGQVLCSQFWKDRYKPRNLVPWGLELMTFLIAAILILVLRFLYVQENKRRDAIRAHAEATGEGLHDFDDFAYVDTVDESGNKIRTKVEKAMLDITDKENLAFRYVL